MADLLLLGTIGLLSANGKMATLLKRFLLKRGALDQTSMIKSLGAQLWYLTLVAESAGTTLTIVALSNLNDIEHKQ